MMTTEMCRRVSLHSDISSNELFQERKLLHTASFAQTEHKPLAVVRLGQSTGGKLNVTDIFVCSSQLQSSITFGSSEASSKLSRLTRAMEPRKRRQSVSIPF